MSKRCLCILIAATCLLQCVPRLPADIDTQQKPALQVRVDPRVELISIIFRLAGNPEYNRARIDSYARDVDKHFLPFKNHPVIELARKLRATRGVSYDAPMSLAVHLTDAFSLEEKIPFEPHPVGLDGRWRLAEVREFLKQARRFVRDTSFSEFIDAHQPLYDQTTQRMKATMARYGHLDWFDQFFGKSAGADFHVILGMLNGGNCYGPKLSTPEKQELYCILGVWSCDKSGIPKFPKTVMPTVVHEFNHSYVNPLAAKHVKDFEKSGRKIFPAVKETMARQAYASWETVTHESIVRACVVHYRLAFEGPLAALSEISQQHARGFVWVGRLSGLLADYEQNRDDYPTFEAFMPRIVKFFDEYAVGLPDDPDSDKTSPDSPRPVSR